MLLLLAWTAASFPGYSQGILITNGAQLVLNGSPQLVVQDGGFTNNGQFVPGNGAVVFRGSAATSSSFVAGSATTDFYNLIINKSPNGIQLNRNIGVSNQLSFISGDSLFLNNFIIDLGTTGSLVGETGTRRITGRTGGYLQITQHLNAPSSVNPGNVGFRISSAANLGSTIIRRGHQQQGGASIYRYYDIIPANNSALDATAEFFFFEQELGMLAEPNLAFFSSTNGGVNWTNLGQNGIDQTNNFITLTTVNSLSRYTLAHISDPLSVRWLYFTATPDAGTVKLQWSTAFENQSHMFDVQRSADGARFVTLGTLPAKGQSGSASVYHYADVQPLSTGFYRIRETDLNARQTFSVVLKVDISGAAPKDCLYPNPVRGTQFTVHAWSSFSGTLTLRLSDMTGRLLRQIPVSVSPGPNQIGLDTGNLPAGMYRLSWVDQGIHSLLLLRQ